jgi:hypothetical protein
MVSGVVNGRTPMRCGVHSAQTCAGTEFAVLL